VPVGISVSSLALIFVLALFEVMLNFVLLSVAAAGLAGVPGSSIVSATVEPDMLSSLIADTVSEKVHVVVPVAAEAAENIPTWIMKKNVMTIMLIALVITIALY
jgi:hypothetical protein